MIVAGDATPLDGTGKQRISWHARRFARTLAAALDMDPGLIKVAPITDPYGTPRQGLLPAESARIAHMKEHAARVIHEAAMQGVKPGDSLEKAAERFTEMVSDPKRALFHYPGRISRAIATVILM